MKHSHLLAASLVSAALMLSASGCISSKTSVSTPESSVESSTAAAITTTAATVTEEASAAPEESSVPAETTTEPTTPPAETTAAQIFTKTIEVETAPEEPDIPVITTVAATTTTVTTPPEELPEEAPDVLPVGEPLMSLLQDGDWMCNVTITAYSTDGGTDNIVIPASAEDTDHILGQLFSINVAEMEYTEPSVLQYTLVLDDGNGVYNTINLPLNENWLSYSGKTYTITDGALDLEHLRKLVEANGTQVIPTDPTKPEMLFNLMQEPFSMARLKILTSTGEEITAESSADCTLLNAQLYSMYVIKSELTELPSIDYTFTFSGEDESITNVIDLCQNENMLRYGDTVYTIESGALNLEFLQRLIETGGSTILPEDAPIAISAESESLPECDVPVYRPINQEDHFIVVYATPEKVYYDMIEEIDAEVGKPLKLMLPYEFYDILKACDQAVFNLHGGYERELGQELYFLEDTQHDYLYRRVLSPDDILRINDGALTQHSDGSAFVYKDTVETDLIIFNEDFHYGMTLEELDAFIADRYESSVSLAQFMAENPDIDFELMPDAFNFYNGICIRANISFEE